MRLIRSELMKIRTTNIWWIFTIGIFIFTTIMLLVWSFVVADQQITAATNPDMTFFPPPAEAGVPPEEVERMRQEWMAQFDLQKVLVNSAVQIYTSGQFFNLLFVMLLGAILVTNEFFHQTATATFLTTPKRTKVILAKLGAASIFAAIFWVATTALCLAVGAIFFRSKGYGPQLDEWEVIRAILMNGLAYGLWGVLGVGLGVLLRSQIAAVVTGAVAYVIGSQAVQLVAFLVYEYWIKKDWVIEAMVLWPSVASQVMISPDQFLGGGMVESPKWWVGALVLVGYGIVFGLIGTLITRKRDIT
jgi:ABC-2 type transport system permease protein